MRTNRFTGAARTQAPLDRRFAATAAFSVASTTACVMGSFFVGALAVQLREELGLQVRDIGVLVAVYFLVSALLSSPGGRLAEAIGAGAAIRLGALASAAGLAVIGLGSSLVHAAAGMVLCGVANAVGQVGANRYIADRTDTSRRGFAFGIKQAGIPASSLLAGLAVPGLALTVGWRWAFFAGAAFATAMAALSPSGPRRAALRGAARAALRRAARAEVPLRVLAVLSAGAGFGAAAANAFGAYLVDSSVEAGMAEGAAGLLFAAGSAVGLTVRVALGWLADRRSHGRLRWVALQLASGVAGFALLAWASALRLTWPLVPATLLCFAGAWGWPGLFNFAVAIRNPRAPAAATGVTQTGTYVGGIAGPLLFGAVADRASYPAAWLVAAALAGAGSLLIVAGRRMLLRGGLPEEIAPASPQP